MKCVVILFGVLFILKYNEALEYSKRPLNANTDFLLHEAGGQINGPKKDSGGSGSLGQPQYNSQNGGQRDYDAQFPALGQPVTPKSTSTTAQSNSNSRPQQSPQSSNGKRDYVAPQFPTLKPTQHQKPVTSKPTATTVNHNKSGPQQNAQSSNGKRDYVASQYPTLKPTSNVQSNNNKPAGGQVQDLINLYDGKTPNRGTTSYSSILKSTTNKNGPSFSTAFTQPKPTSMPFQPTKPVSPGVEPNKPANSGVTTAKPNTPGSRPGTPVLPSSIVNNNRDTTSNNGNSISDAELQTLSEELLRKDSNNAARYITINYQDKTTSHSTEDKAPSPLLTLSPEVWNIPTIQKFVPLLDNYEKDSLVNEHVTPQERIEENTFMDAIMSTAVMRHLMTYLKNKDLVSRDLKVQRDFVKQLWFTLYSRGKGKIGSSGFEHIFVSELKNGQVSGLHNWIYFAKEEAANRVNYLGYLKYESLNDKGAVLKYHFNQQGVDKPVNTMFIGTSPELEIALYTLCYVTRVDDDCKLKLGNKDVNIVTYNFRYRSKNLIGSAFPQI